jgi:hypothetical protein
MSFELPPPTHNVMGGVGDNSKLKTKNSNLMFEVGE